MQLNLKKFNCITIILAKTKKNNLINDFFLKITSLRSPELRSAEAQAQSESLGSARARKPGAGQEKHIIFIHNQLTGELRSGC